MEYSITDILTQKTKHLLLCVNTAELYDKLYTVNLHHRVPNTDTTLLRLSMFLELPQPVPCRDDDYIGRS